MPAFAHLLPVLVLLGFSCWLPTAEAAAQVPGPVRIASPGTIQVVTPAAPWQRRAFNGLAQVIIQTTRQPGEITLTASAQGLKMATLERRAGHSPASRVATT